MHARRIAGWAGGALLAATAIFHATGFTDIRNFAATLPEQGFMAQALPGIWVLPTVHWLAMAFATIVAVRSGGSGARLLLIGIGAVVLMDALAIFLSVGPFVGGAMLGAAALLIGGAGVFSVRSSRA